MKILKLLTSSSAVTLITILLATLPGSNSLQGYNEPCELYDETSTCDDTIGLMCMSSGVKGYRCKCPSSDTQFGTVYDSKRHRCVGKVFNNCVSSLTPTKKGPQIPDNSNNRTFFCVENADCNTSVYYLPICLCKKGYFETDDGTCAPVAKYGESCNDDMAQCDSKYGLKCHEGKCTCHGFYEKEEERCVTYVGQSCSLEEDLCVPNAFCQRTSKFPIMGNPNSNPNSRLPPKSTIIFGSDSQEATKSADTSFLSGAVARQDDGSSSDRRNINSNNNIGLLDSGLEPPAKCMCKSGFSQTQDGFCMKSYGNICKMMADRNSSESCNPDQYLECLDAHDGHFRCQCRNPLNERWNKDRHQCVSIIGKKCRPFPSYPECDAGSECLNGSCHCKRGTSLTPIGSCKLDYNERCEPGECNVYSGLTCHGKTGTCLCLDSYLKYDMKKKACLATLGSPCGSVNLMEFSGVRGDGVRFFGGGGPQQNRKGGSSSEGIPFIGCEEGSTCSPQVSGNQMVYYCTRK